MPAALPYARSRVRLFYNNVAELRQILGVMARYFVICRLSTGPKHLDFQVSDLLAQGVAVDPQEISSADLIAPRSCQRDRQQRVLDLPQDTVIEPRGRQTLPESGEIGGQMALDSGRQPLLCGRLLSRGHRGRLGEF